MSAVWLISPGPGGRTLLDITDRSDGGALIASASLSFTDDEMVELMAAMMGKLIAHDPAKAHTFLVAAARGLDDFEATS